MTEKEIKEFIEKIQVLTQGMTKDQMWNKLKEETEKALNRGKK